MAAGTLEGVDDDSDGFLAIAFLADLSKIRYTRMTIESLAAATVSLLTRSLLVTVRGVV